MPAPSDWTTITDLIAERERLHSINAELLAALKDLRKCIAVLLDDATSAIADGEEENR